MTTIATVLFIIAVLGLLASVFSGLSERAADRRKLPPLEVLKQWFNINNRR